MAWAFLWTRCRAAWACAHCWPPLVLLFLRLQIVRGRKTGMLLGISVFFVGTGVVIFWPTFPGFVLATMLTLLGKVTFDPAMQAFIGDRVPYQRRGLALHRHRTVLVDRLYPGCAPDRLGDCPCRLGGAIPFAGRPGSCHAVRLGSCAPQGRGQHGGAPADVD